MVGRYVINTEEYDLSERFKLRIRPLFAIERYNAAPTQDLPVVVATAQGRELRAMRWGIVAGPTRPGMKPISPFNARSETVFEKPMFKRLIDRRRCVVPANGYYEWQTIAGRKEPFLFGVADQPVLGFAGIYEVFHFGHDVLESFAIMTTTPNEFAAKFHNRMPVILAEEDEERWLDSTIGGHAVAGLLRPFPAELMTATRVSSGVNDVRNEGRKLLDLDPPERAGG
jgi:putative SOS response-associated peptidase YedK